MPTFPRTDVEHERWSRRTLWSTLARRLDLHRLSSKNEAVVYVAGSMLPWAHGHLLQARKLYLDLDDPLSLFGRGARNNIPLEQYRQLALKFAALGGLLRLSFWSQTQLGNFLANLPADLARELLERGVVAALPPAIAPKPVSPTARGQELLRCLCIASGKFWHKGVADTIAAMSLLAQRGVPAKLTLVADMIPAEWEAYARSLPNVDILSRLPRERLDALYRSHDLLIFLSHHDTFGWVILEAKSFGLPTLATRFYNRAEIVEHEADGVLLSDPFANPFFPVQAEPYCGSHLSVGGGGILKMTSWIEPYIEDVVSAIERLAFDRTILKKLARGALASVEAGAKFGVSTRMSRLEERLAWG